MAEKERLQKHYNRVYVNAQNGKVQAVQLKGTPNDRHQMAVFLPECIREVAFLK